jgi:3-oxoacyl-[acyl-carrier protein] reductase
VDVCVTNSGGHPSNLFKNTPPEARRRCRGALDEHRLFARETAAHAEEQWGRLVKIPSSAVKQPADGQLLSNSIRAAVTGLARTLANEYGTSIAVDGGLVRSLL